MSSEPEQAEASGPLDALAEGAADEPSDGVAVAAADGPAEVPVEAPDEGSPDAPPDVPPDGSADVPGDPLDGGRRGIGAATATQHAAQGDDDEDQEDHDQDTADERPGHRRLRVAGGTGHRARLYGAATRTAPRATSGRRWQDGADSTATPGFEPLGDSRRTDTEGGITARHREVAEGARMGRPWRAVATAAAPTGRYGGGLAASSSARRPARDRRPTATPSPSAGLRQAVLAAPPAERAVVVHRTAGRAEVEALDALAVPQLEQALRRPAARSLSSPGPARSPRPGWTDDRTDQLALASYQDLDRHATLTAGRWPVAGRDPIEATLSEGAAAALGLDSGTGSI